MAAENIGAARRGKRVVGARRGRDGRGWAEGVARALRRRLAVRAEVSRDALAVGHVARAFGVGLRVGRADAGSDGPRRAVGVLGADHGGGAVGAVVSRDRVAGDNVAGQRRGVGVVGARRVDQRLVRAIGGGGAWIHGRAVPGAVVVVTGDGLTGLALRGAGGGARIVRARVGRREVLALWAVRIGRTQGCRDRVRALGVLGLNGSRVTSNGLAVRDVVGALRGRGEPGALNVVLPAVVGNPLCRAVKVGRGDTLDVGFFRMVDRRPVLLEPFDGSICFLALTITKDDGLNLTVLILQSKVPELLGAT